MAKAMLFFAVIGTELAELIGIDSKDERLMDKVIYIASNAASRSLYEQGVKSNNLANIGTTGFKKDITQAKTYTLKGSVYPSRAYALSLPNAQDKTHGGIETTGNPLDVAVEGDGWIAVQNDVGFEAYTRNGKLQINNVGALVTSSGSSVVGNGGPIVIPPAEKVLIGNDGTISIQPAGQPDSAMAVVNQIKLVNPGNNALSRDEDGLFYMQGENATAAADNTVRVQSGALELSNVNGVSEMVDMISLSRQFEIYMKMISTADEKSANTARLLQQN